MQINGTNHDGMDAFHILNSDLRKSLGFVTPFFAHGQRMWKHESSLHPAYYNAVDAASAGTNMRGTIALLKKNGMYKVYNDFICELDPVFSAMTKAGMPIDQAQRAASSKQLLRERNELHHYLEAVVPQEIRTFSPRNGYVRTPKDTRGLVKITLNAVVHEECSKCGLREPKKSHFKSKLVKQCSQCGSKWTAKHGSTKPTKSCAGATAIERESNDCAGHIALSIAEGEKRWAKLEPFKISNKSIIRYQQNFKHPLIMVGKGEDRKATTDEKAIRQLIGKHPDHKFYEYCLDDREYGTIGSRYIGWWDEAEGRISGGMPVGRDGRVHGHFRHTPSTLRSSMVAPNLQNIPRGDDEGIQRLVKAMFVAPWGQVFVERDFSGIEAVLVGYHCGSVDYYRLAHIDVHSYLTAHNLYRQGIFTAKDLPDLSWSDNDLRAYLKGIKKKYPNERTVAKIMVHSSNYRIGPKHLSEAHPLVFHRIKDAAAALAFYYEVFPAIPAWHERLCLEVDRTAVFKNSFGHIQRFYQVLNWEKRGSKWEWNYGDDAKRLIACGPQSDAALIGKKALKRLFYNYPDTIAQWLRLFIHDSIFTECPEKQTDYVDKTMQFEMEKLIEEMPLDPTWNMGPFLQVFSESKRGTCWGDMH